MSKTYQIFLKEASNEIVETVIGKMNGYKNELGEYTIQVDESTIWISLPQKMDKEFYSEETVEIYSKYGLEVNYVLNIEISSYGSSEDLACRFFENLTCFIKSAILMNQDGDYLKKLNK
ncbi:hypothetical protein ACYSNR_15620 [Enterococcus sp. LJL128]